MQMALSDSAARFPSLTGTLSSAGGRETTEVGCAMNSNRQFSLIFSYFCVNSIEKLYRKACINNLCESKAKILENCRKSAVVEYFR